MNSFCFSNKHKSVNFKVEDRHMSRELLQEHLLHLHRLLLNLDLKFIGIHHVHLLDIFLHLRRYILSQGARGGLVDHVDLLFEGGVGEGTHEPDFVLDFLLFVLFIFGLGLLVLGDGLLLL